MGLVLDTVLLDLHNAATTAVGLTPSTPATGDSLSVRSFAANAYAKLEAVFLHASAGPRRAQITSPRMHDNVTGIALQFAELPTEFALPRYVGEPLYSADTLTVQLDAAASSDTVAALLNYYSDIPGSAADLRNWGDIAGRIKHIKAMQVAVTSSATIGQWSDTVITTTDNQLHADAEYAVLGFETSAALLTFAIKGPATSNYRVGCPGSTETTDVTEYFITMGEKHNTPHIPVFKANDRNSTYVSVAAPTASVGADVFAILAELA